MSRYVFPNRPVYADPVCLGRCDPTHSHGDHTMDDSVQEFLRTNPHERVERKPARKTTKGDMSRGTMTAWICGTLLVLGLGALYFATRMDPMERNADCQTVFGMDQQCVQDNAIRRLRGYPY